MVEAGLDVARLNFSHGDRELHAENAERVRAAASSAGRQVADPPGPAGTEAPHRPAADDIAELKPGEKLILACGTDRAGRRRRCPSAGPGWPSAVDPEDVIYLADGAIRLRVKAVREGDGESRLRSRSAAPSPRARGSTSRARRAACRRCPRKTCDMLRFGESIGVDLVALSFVRTAEDVDSVRKHTRLPLIAKIEKPQAVERPRRSSAAADCVMVARGDLGIELPIEQVPMVQKQLLRIAGRLARPRSPPRRCSIRWSPPPAPPAPRWPTSPTRSSTAPTR